MTVVHTNWGFTGTVDQVAEAKRFDLLTPRFRVGSFTDWQPTVSGSVPRTVSVAPGAGAACGVGSSTGAADAVAHDPNGGGSDRYDAVVATFDWSIPDVTFQAIKGTTSPPQVNPSGTSVVAGQINRVPGVRYDALLGVTRIPPGQGVLTSGLFTDCRMWGGTAGPVNTGSGKYLSLLDTDPADLVLAADTWIQWQRLQGGLWGFDKWLGTDKSQQPMYSLGNNSFSVTNDHSTLVTTWPNGVDHGGGLVTYNAGKLRLNNHGRVRIEGYALSDALGDGWSWLSVTSPAGGGNYLNVMENLAQRGSGYTGGGVLRQYVDGTFRAVPGDEVGLTIWQLNPAGNPLSYQTLLAATYL